MSNWNFYPCNKPEHDNYRLDRVCISPKCNQHQLVCTICSENEHQSCNPPSIKSFLTQFRQQLQSPSTEKDNQFERLIAFCDQIQKQMELALKNIQEIVEEKKKIINNVKKNIRESFLDQRKRKQQKEKLDKFEQNMNQQNFAELVNEIEDFRTNPDKFQFSIKKKQGPEMTQIEDRIENGNIYVQQYIDTTNSIIQQFKKQNEDIQINLENYFFIPPKRSNYHEETNLNKTFSFSHQITTPPKVQEKQPNTIDTKNTNRNIQNEQVNRSLNPNFNRSSLIQINNSQIQKTQQQETNQEKKISIYNSQQNQAKQVSTSQLPPNQRSTQQQQPSQQIQNAVENKNQVKFETVLLQTNGQEITKLLFLSNKLIAACYGTNCLVSDITTSRLNQVLDAKGEITDAAYMENDVQNGILVLATKQGKVQLYRRAQDFQQSFTLIINQLLQIYEPGNNILISINQQKKVMVTLGDNNIIKIWKIDPFECKDKFELDEPGTVLHVNSEFIHVGCRSHLRIFDFVKKYDKYLNIPETNNAITNINTCENKLVVVLQDKIMVFQRRDNGDYSKTYEKVLGDIRCLNLLSKIPIVIVSNPLEKQQVFVYNYQENKVMDLQIQMVKVCAVREDWNSYLIGLSQASGQFLIYTIELTQQLQQSK